MLIECCVCCLPRARTRTTVTYSYETHDEESGKAALMGFVVGKHARYWMQRSQEVRLPGRSVP